ncbi:hypothetical protein BDR07DRAFT_1381103 [Suillus spraguei]|nr:hypothetical protein BDR07DRAFT_1381103 [Suillus spraguei]
MSGLCTSLVQGAAIEHPIKLLFRSMHSNPGKSADPVRQKISLGRQSENSQSMDMKNRKMELRSTTSEFMDGYGRQMTCWTQKCTRAVHLPVHMPEMEMHARGEDRKDESSQAMYREVYAHQKTLLEPRTFTVERTFKTIIIIDEDEKIWKCRLTQTACIIEYVMLHQNGVHTAVGRSPGLDDTYEC